MDIYTWEYSSMMKWEEGIDYDSKLALEPSRDTELLDSESTRTQGVKGNREASVSKKPRI
jgi:hypothetical protein